jgi:hypothetical protein
MSKAILSLLAAALVCAAGTSALASDEISTSTLSSMGLSGMQVMTDGQALAVRGMGFMGGRNGYMSRRDDHKQEASKPWAKADGKSWASVDLDGQHSEDAGAGSHNSYAAEGKYEASGENFSEATLSKTDSTIVGYTDGTYSSETMVHTIHVEAGGFSSAKAF